MSKDNNRKPILAITMGDSNGVSPEIILKALDRLIARAEVFPVVFGSLSVLEDAKGCCGIDLPMRHVERIEEAVSVTDVIPVIDFGYFPGPWRPGELRAEAGRCAVEWFRAAVSHAMQSAVDAVVTCPLNKEGIHLAGYKDFPGHTEMAAVWTGTSDFRMSLFAGAMRSVFVTAHLPLREAVASITVDRIANTIRMAQAALLKIGIQKPRIAVAGINPHAGENGILGSEDREIVAPAVWECQQAGICCDGPLVPDAVFRHMQEGRYDIVVSMYHDQGHIPLKLVAMDEGVNVTLGLPIVRTSVDHGTAYDIAGRGIAREHSLISAMTLAAQLCSHARNCG
ncbi:MAG: 4-hydroxythreonine-4-phosphate dehydrogenase [Candidatus Hydrogenedentota bacterium]